MSDQQHVHLIGICGTAMASLAGLLRQRGFKVTGSDTAAYPPMSDFLASMSISVAQPYSEANLKPRPDLVVVGNAISRGNPELEYVLDEKMLYRSMPYVLYEQFLRTREPVVVAGTHGKTTTTSMLAWIFQTAGKDPSFLIGGVAENFGSSFALKQGKHFIVEGDEYDTAFFDKGPKFLHYFPQTVILTSVEFDHADIYKDLDAVKKSFKQLVNLVPRKGKIVAYDNNANVDECVSKAFCAVERYGFQSGSHWQAIDVGYEPERTSWTVLREGSHWADFEFALAGEYNVLNATGAAALAAHYGIETAAIAEALKSFKSVKRRLEIKAQVDGITIIDDFAHHPTAIAETLKALRTRYPGSRLWAIFEPRSNTMRRNILEKELAHGLAQADNVVIASIFNPDAIPEQERLEIDSVVSGLQKSGKSARELKDADAIVQTVAPELREGDVVAILSNGGFGGIYEKLPLKLAELRAVRAR
ncbi:MAG TPA: UDP-N-acetylmuramate:L-alanyl-gamma-D-glutamyl-meso-diaminopimelate ligase [Candidatus Angelobacter sp.]|nr:UDP-N-acetylmuramate:L-alanyl-gamma-D-glutamyl-meso-diaminopimelate ligase [Candidatus Angelobacter sp.]